MTEKILLHTYQIECIKSIEDFFKNSNRQMIQLPTGAGKTFIFLNYLSKNSDKCVIICPGTEIQEQIYHWAKFFLKNKKIRKKICSKDVYQADVYILTAASLNFESTYSKLKIFEFDHIIIDEAHKANAPTYINFLEKIKMKKFNLLGCTATPERLDGKSLIDIFGHLTFSRNIHDLILQGFLCDIKAYRFKTNFNIPSQVTNQNDFKPNILKFLDCESRNNLIFKVYQENCLDKKTLIFCINIDHAIKISNFLKEKGFASEHISARDSKSVRKEKLKKFKSGEIQVLTNCQLLTEGFDEPSIEALIITRPTRSKSLYCQMLGRGVRKCVNKQLCYLYELTDNNHKICTFNITVDKPNEFEFEYPQGITLTELKIQTDFMSINEFFLEKQEFQVFDTQTINNKIDVFQSIFHKTTATYSQISKLKQLNIQFIQPLSVLEAEFLLWKEKAFKIYGINKTG